MIDGVDCIDLKFYSDDRGVLVEVLKEGTPLYQDVKQTTYTEAYPGTIKAFHWHQKQTDIWFFSRGMAQVVLHDLRDESPTRGETNVFIMGEKAPRLLTIPPGVAHGYRVLGTETACLFYHTTEAYNTDDPDEKRLPYDDPGIGFDWTTRPR
jgi:dTDP-4-dehydrorhamnose 3,5-epimerase